MEQIENRMLIDSEWERVEDVQILAHRTFERKRKAIDEMEYGLEDEE